MFNENDLVVVSKPPLEKYKLSHKHYYQTHKHLLESKTVLRIVGVCDPVFNVDGTNWIIVDYEVVPGININLPTNCLSKVYEC